MFAPLHYLYTFAPLDADTADHSSKPVALIYVHALAAKILHYLLDLIAVPTLLTRPRPLGDIAISGQGSRGRFHSHHVLLAQLDTSPFLPVCQPTYLMSSTF